MYKSFISCPDVTMFQLATPQQTKCWINDDKFSKMEDSPCKQALLLAMLHWNSQ